MSATNPQKVKDLIHRFGWDFVARLASLGIQHQAEAQVLFVDSGAANTLDADDTVHGMSFENPLATIDYAIGLCVADEGAIILVAPGHNESLGDAQIDFDVAGVTCICLGHGTLRPRVDFDHANASINIGANDVTIINLGLLPAITGVLIGVDVESSVTNFRMAECEFMIGEDGAGDDEFVKAAELKSGNHDCVFENVKILAHASAGGATHGINVAAASNRLTFKNVIIDGPYATGGIVEAAAGVNHVVEDCAVDTTGTNFSFHGSSTFAKRTNNIDGQVTEDESESLLLTTRGTGAYPTGITNESILAYIMGKGATASASSFDNSEHSLEAIGDNVLNISSPTDVTGAVGTAPTGRSLQDILEKDANGTFDDGTDSLEAIRDHLDGSTILAGINLDHLLKTTTEVAVDGELDQHVTALSVLGHIMATDADPSSYNCSTDSLQSIAAAINALSFATAVSQTPTARSLQDILEKDNSGSFNDATDSLEAIRDHLDGTTVLGGIQLDHLAQTVSAGTDYPTEITTDSILGMLMSANGNPNGFNKTTDSLAALRDRIDALNVADQTDIDAILVDTATTIPGTITTMQGNITDILEDTLTTIPGTITTLQGNVTDILEDTLTTIPGTITTLQGNVTDILADTIMISGGALPVDPTAGSLARYIASGGTSLGQPLPTDMSLIDLIGNYTGSHDETEADDNIKAHLDLIYTDSQAIVTDTAAMAERTVEKSDGAVLNGDDDIFDISGGPILVTNLVGIVTTLVGGAANLSIIETTTEPGGDTNLSTAVAVDDDAAGTSYTFTSAVPSVLTPTTVGVLGGVATPSWLCPIGTIKAKGSAAQDGVIKWYLTYKPLSPSSVVVAAT